MDHTASRQFIENVAAWARAQYQKQGWRLPHWDMDDWQQQGACVALMVLRRYDRDGKLQAAHGFALARTILMNELVDSARSVRAQDSDPLDDSVLLNLRCDDAPWVNCWPPAAQRLMQAMLDTPPAVWDAREASWRAKGRKKADCSVAGLSYVLQLPENEVAAGIVSLRAHLTAA